MKTPSPSIGEGGWTPGPWSVRPANGDYAPVSEAPLCIHGDGWDLAVVVADVSDLRRAASANAALIAAAPALYEALRAVMALRDRGYTKAVAKSLGLEAEAAMSNTWIEIPYQRARSALALAHPNPDRGETE